MNPVRYGMSALIWQGHPGQRQFGSSALVVSKSVIMIFRERKMRLAGVRIDADGVIYGRGDAGQSFGNMVEPVTNRGRDCLREIAPGAEEIRIALDRGLQKTGLLQATFLALERIWKSIEQLARAQMEIIGDDVRGRR